jgi:alpha-1,3-mannosyltransferase
MGSSSAMNILHVVRQFSPSIGGLEDYVVNLSKQQMKHGHDVDVLTLDINFQSNEKLISNEIIDDINVYRIGSIGPKKYKLAFVKVGFLNAYDIVHVHAVDFFIDYISLLKRIGFLKANLYLTTHGGFFHTNDYGALKKVFFNTITKFSLKIPNKIFTISKNDHDIFSKINSNCTLLQNAVSLRKFGDVSHLNEKADFVYVGRLSKNKKLTWLIETFSRLPGNESKLIIIGRTVTGDYKELIDAKEKYNTDNVVLYFDIPDSEIVELVSNSRFVISASEYEGFGLGVVELMSYGLVPFLSSLPPTFIQFVEESKCGANFVYDQDSFNSSYNELLLGYSEKCSNLAIAYAEKFSWSELSEKIENIYEYPTKDNSFFLDILTKIRVFDDSDSAVNYVINEMSDSITTLGFCNHYSLNLVSSSNLFYSNFDDLDIIFRDGIGSKIAMSLFGMKYGFNLNGTDFIPRLVESFNKNDPNFIVLGTEDPWLEKGAYNLLGNNFFCLDGFKQDNEYIDFLQSNMSPYKTNIVILAMGMPKQERIAALIKKEIDFTGLVICGGAVIDFYAGRYKRAPEYLRKLNLEWLYRLYSEPKRLFKRYVFGIPVFFFNILKSKVF